MFVTDWKIKLYDGPRFESPKIINFFFFSFVYMFLFVYFFLLFIVCLELKIKVYTSTGVWFRNMHNVHADSYNLCFNDF